MGYAGPPQFVTGPPMLLRQSTIFFAAFAVRAAYSLLLYATMADAGLATPDSIGYLDLARDFASAITQGKVRGLAWLGPSPAQMPLFTWLLTLHALMFGALASLAYVLMQAALDAATCVVIYRTAQVLDERYAVPAAIAAILNPTQIVVAGLVLSDTPFVLLAAIFLYVALVWLRAPSWRSAVALGLAVAAAALIRISAATFLPVLLIFLLAALAIAKRLTLSATVQLVAAAAIAAICVAPVLWRNVSLYDVWSLTPQGGEHLARHVVPFVKEAYDGTPRSRTQEEIDRRRSERFGPMSANPFEQSRQFTELGVETLRPLGIGAIVKAWTLGAALNLATPAIIQSPPVAQLSRTGFFATPGASSFDKIGNYLFRSDNALFAWALLLGIAGLVIVRLIQLRGLLAFAPTRAQWPALCLFGLWMLYVLGTSGPIASAKYRLPLEPPLMVLTGVGLSALWRRPQAGRSA